MKRIALINDLSGFGKCSLTAAIPVISVMGMQACPLPTAVLSAQTEFENYYLDDYTDKMDFITENWLKLGISFDGIYSGYTASARQITKILHFLEAFQGKDTLYLADPVLGDGGLTYTGFSKELLQGMKELTLKANVITPNLTELCLLADADYHELISCSHKEDYLKRIRHLCELLLNKASVTQTIVVTGILHCEHEKKKASVGNLAISSDKAFYIENPYTGEHFSGTGDLFASILCGSLVKGLTLEEAMQKAARFLQKAIEEAGREHLPHNHGVPFEKYLSELL